jgi:uncharacterized RDD family membrane protein YckC
VLAAYLLLLEWRFGTTAGKHIFGITVRSLGGGPMDFLQAAKRLLLRLIMLLPATTLENLPGSSTDAHRITFRIVVHDDPGLETWSAVFSVLALAYFINFIITTPYRALPLHDRLAKTEAVRLIGD